MVPQRITLYPAKFLFVVGKKGPTSLRRVATTCRRLNGFHKSTQRKGDVSMVLGSPREENKGQALIERHE
jgi:hypothetical protein